jgi:hypothetical protein
MAAQRFLTLFAVVSMAATAALVLGMHGGGTAWGIAAALAGLVALVGMAVLARVVLVSERARRRQ